ncbi:MAG TPA: hypothetical protein VFF27_18735 [Bacteroidia bacterium]|jgi:hypothetical protein|nr:hypothetical protein [Bacteroidia bacterium]
MKNLKEFEVKNLDQITGGSDVVIKFSGFFDGVKSNEDIRIGLESNTSGNQ